MEFVTQDAKYSLTSLMTALSRDIESWEGWKCLHISFISDEPAHIKKLQDCILDTLRGRFEHHPGKSFVLEREILLITKETSDNFLVRVSYELQETAQKVPDAFMNLSVFDITASSDALLQTYSCHALFSVRKGQENLQKKPLRKTQDTERDNLNLALKKVLLVEDDATTRWLVRHTLKGHCMLATAQDARCAMDAYRRYRPDMVLLDLNLPGGNGRDVMNDILRHDPGAHVVIFSSHDSVDNLVHLLEDGARGFIPKPFCRDKLLRYVTAAPGGIPA